MPYSDDDETLCSTLALFNNCSRLRIFLVSTHSVQKGDGKISWNVLIIQGFNYKFYFMSRGIEFIAGE